MAQPGHVDGVVDDIECSRHGKFDREVPEEGAILGGDKEKGADNELDCLKNEKDGEMKGEKKRERRKRFFRGEIS